MNSYPLRCLVVDDNELQRRTVVRQLTRLGAASVTEAGDGHQALAHVRSGEPVDLVICDVRMPGMDGMELMRRLHEIDCRASIIIASALDQRLLKSVATMTQAYGLRLLGVVEKPLSGGKLSHLLQKHEPPAAPGATPVARLPVFTAEEVLAGIRAGELEAYFQPKLEIGTAAVRGMEALARWHHPVHGLVPPSAFIEVLEQNAGIDELTFEMLRQSAQRCSDWHARGHPLSVCVNLSLGSLAVPGLAERLAKIVDGVGVAPDQLVFEVTESAAATHVARALETLARIRMWGFGLSIDDYGTGYSSMQQLSRIAFTELKIDRAFVTNAADDPAARVILSSSVDMARQLGILSVAEGVETRDDLRLLEELGCEVAQGFLVAEPLPPSQVLGWLDAWKRSH